MASNLSSTYNENFGQIADYIGDLQENQNKTNIAISNLQAQFEQLKTLGSTTQTTASQPATSGIFGSQYTTANQNAIVIQQQNAVMKFYLLVRDYVLNSKPWTQAIRYQTKVDERFDMTLVSQRVYGHREEFITVQASANLDSTEQELTEQLLVLPPVPVLQQLKQRAGYFSQDAYRTL